jgi:hypothetical protein
MLNVMRVAAQFLSNARDGIARAVVHPYAPHAWFWESVLMGQRLVRPSPMIRITAPAYGVIVWATHAPEFCRPCDFCEQILAFVYTFVGAHRGIQALSLSLLCGFFMALHLTWAPLRNPQAQTLQSVLLCCTMVVAISCIPFAVSIAIGSVVDVQSAGGTVFSFSRSMRFLFAELIPVFAVGWSFGGHRALSTVKAIISRRFAQQ